MERVEFYRQVAEIRRAQRQYEISRDPKLLQAIRLGLEIIDQEIDRINMILAQRGKEMI